MDFIKWFLFEAAMKERGEFIVNLVICLTLVFAIIYFSLLKGYKIFYSRCKKTKEKTFKKVLVKGDFGSGKTHYVNHDEKLFNFLKLDSKHTKTLENYKKKLYISCTGKTSNQLLKELYFNLLPKLIKFFETKDVLDMIAHVFHVRKYDVSDIKDYILKSASQKYDVIIIDDFERMCFDESINDEIHQFTRLILEKLEKYFHIVFVHSTNSRRFAGLQSDSAYCAENFDSNINYLLEKNDWNMIHLCETEVEKCSSIDGVYEKWNTFFEEDPEIVETYLSSALWKLRETPNIDFYKKVSSLFNNFYCSGNEVVKEMFHTIIIESIYTSIKSNSFNNIESNKGIDYFNYRIAKSFTNGLEERNVADFFIYNSEYIPFDKIIFTAKNQIQIDKIYVTLKNNNLT